MSSVEVDIFGRRYKIKGEDTQKLTKVAEHFNQQLMELSEQNELLEFPKLLLLCGLQLQEKVLELTQITLELKEELERMNTLISAFIPELAEK